MCCSQSRQGRGTRRPATGQSTRGLQVLCVEPRKLGENDFEVVIACRQWGAVGSHPCAWRKARGGRGGCCGNRRGRAHILIRGAVADVHLARWGLCAFGWEVPGQGARRGVPGWP